MLIPVAIFVWFFCGSYAVFANEERTHRLYRTDEPDLLQAFLTFMIGPIGVWFVMKTGGRWLFWRKP